LQVLLLDLGSVRKDVEEVFYLVKQFEVLPYQVKFFAKRSTNPPRFILFIFFSSLFLRVLFSLYYHIPYPFLFTSSSL
jgi:hypothetical protein